MFSILGMINSYIGYFSMNAKLKSQVYTALGTLGNFYLLYVAYRFFANGFYLRGFLYILAFLVLAYFAYLNILYYFTKDKSSKYDITPKSSSFSESRQKTIWRNTKNARIRHRAMFKRTAFSRMRSFSVRCHDKCRAKANIQALVKDLANVGYLDLNYGGMSEDDMLAIVRKVLQRVFKPWPNRSPCRISSWSNVPVACLFTVVPIRWKQSRLAKSRRSVF